MLDMDVSSIYKLCAANVIPSIRIGEKAVRIPRVALDAYLAKQAGTTVRQGRALLDEARSISGDPEESIHRQVESFATRSLCSPQEFVEQWRAGEIADSPETSDLLIEALGLRAALDRVGQRHGILV